METQRDQTNLGGVVRALDHSRTTLAIDHYCGTAVAFIVTIPTYLTVGYKYNTDGQVGLIMIYC